jgi:hypothetical protein
VRLCFHFLLLAFSLLETASNVCLLVFEHLTRLGYAMHTIALLMNLAAFSMVILLWGKTVALPREFACVKRFVAAALMVNIAACTAEVCVMMQRASIEDFLEQDPLVYLAALIIHSVTIFVLAVVMLALGIRLQWRSAEDDLHWSSVLNSDQRFGIVLRVNLVLLCCVLFYTLRFVTLMALLFDRLRNTSYVGIFSLLMWNVLSVYLPTIVPGLALLYVMKARRRAQLDVACAWHSEAEPLISVRGFDSSDSNAVESSLGIPPYRIIPLEALPLSET